MDRRISTVMLLSAFGLFRAVGAPAAEVEATVVPKKVVHLRTDDAKVRIIRETMAKTAVATGNGINYHGGPVMSSTITLYYIWYGNWNGNSAVSILENFARNIGGSQAFNTNTTYTDGNGNAVPNTVLFGGSTTDNYSLGTSLSDAQIEQVVAKAISAGKFPSNPNGVYFVLTSADVNETSGFCTQYCGWHTAGTIGTADIKYAFVGDSSRCIGSCAPQSTSPNGNAGADGMASVIFHELSETVSDPDLNAWYDAQGEENGDKCAWNFGGTTTVANGSHANVTLGSMNYLLQQNWVNASGGSCSLLYGVAGLTGISPATGAAGTTVTVTLTGTGFVNGANVQISDSSIGVNSVTVVSSTQITAKLVIPSNAASGVRTLTVNIGPGISQPVNFTIGTPTFAATSVSPVSGPSGASVPVTITGTGFASGASVASSNGTIAVSNVVVVSATKITATLTAPASATVATTNLTVSQSGSVSAPLVYTANAPLVTVTGLTSTTVNAGSTGSFTIAGTGFASPASVAISGTGVTMSNVVVNNATQLTGTMTVDASAATGARNLTVTAAGNTSVPVKITVQPAALTLSSVFPATGGQGLAVPVLLTGANFPAGATVAVSGTGITVSNVVVANATTIGARLTIAANAALGSRTITVSAGGATSAPVTFTVVTPTPTVSQMAPTAGTAGSTVAMSFLGSNFAPGATVAVSGTGVTVSGVTVVNGNQITANFAIAANAAAGARTVTITSSGLTSAPLTFTVNAAAVPPTLAAISPASGVAGSTVAVTLTGTNFASGATVAASGSGITVSGVTVVSPTKLTANLAIASTAAVGARNITVTQGSATTSPVVFTVTAAPAPTLTAISPATGAAGATVPVTLTGTNFLSGATVAVSGSGITVSGVTVVSPTQIKASLAIGATVATGARNITVTQGSATTSPAVFTVTAPPPPTTQPSITSLSPATGATGAVVFVTLTGKNFASNGASLTVSGSGVQVAWFSPGSSTQAYAYLVIAPNATLGDRTLTLSATGVNPATATFTVTAAVTPVITSISPASAAAGSTVTITLNGSNFDPNSDGFTFSGGGVTLTGVTANTPTKIVFTLAISPNATVGAHSLAIVNGSTASAPATFTITH